MLFFAATTGIMRNWDLNSLAVLAAARRFAAIPQTSSISIWIQSQHGNCDLRISKKNKYCQSLTARSCACSGFGPRRPFNCSGLGVAGLPPCSEVMELLTLLEGVVVLSACCGIRLFSLWRDDCEPGAPFPPSLKA